LGVETAVAGTSRRPTEGEPLSKIIGWYQMLLRRVLAHFFPEARLEQLGDRSVIRLNPRRSGANFRVSDDPGGLGLEIEWFRTPYLLQPGVPVPFTTAERRLIETLAQVIDERFRLLYEQDAELAPQEMLPYAFEDLAVAVYLKTPDASRIPAALEALRLAALSTYENRRVSTGVLLLGTPNDPTAPERRNPDEAPRYDAHLTTLKSLHRICDGVNTVFLVDRRGDLAWPVDIHRWARETQGERRPTLPCMCSRTYEPHARATRGGGHVALVLTPAQEIRVFAHGTTTFVYSNGRWRLLDIPSCFGAWAEAVGRTRPSGLAGRIFQAALNLSEQRRGALFVVLRDPKLSMPQLLAREDWMSPFGTEEGEEQHPDDPDALSNRHVKWALHHVVQGQNLPDLDDAVLEAIAGIDGAVVTDRRGRLLSFGAILRVTAETVLSPRAVQGSRTTAALAASFHGPVLKVSEDGYVAMYLGGRRIWEV
jgi:hypothetical protein